MKKAAIALYALASASLFAWFYYWAFYLAPGTDEKAVLDHEFVVAAYAITWAVQLGYVTWLAVKWNAQKRNAAR
jgi:hypothetical protein